MKINVTKSSMPSFEEYIEEIKDIWSSRWLTNHGSKLVKLEDELKKYLKINEIVMFTNGHLALEYAIDYFNFPKGSEIITTPFTFVSTTNSIIRCGMIPVFCDINKEDYTIDVNKIEELITEKTVAIMPVHVYGNICDVEAIEKIAKKHNLKVIYDAAHAFGVKYKGQSILNYGDFSMLSFHATKVFHTIEGGALVFNDKKLKPTIEQQKDFGILDEEDCLYVGGNAKMNEFQAAMGLCNLKHIDEYISKRKVIVEEYNKRLGNTPGIKVLKPQSDVISNYAYYPVVFDGYKYSRDEIKEKLAKHNIGSRKYFYPITNEFSSIKNKYKGDTPVALDISKKVLTLPLFSDLSLEEVNEICDIIEGKSDTK